MEKLMPLERFLHEWQRTHGTQLKPFMIVGIVLAVAFLFVIALRLSFPTYTSFIFKNVRRNMLRTTLASLAIVVLTLIVTAVWSILVPMDAMLVEKTADIKAIVTEKWQVPSQMPYSYASTLERGDPDPSDPAAVRIKEEDSMTWSFYAGTTDPAKITFESVAFFFVMDPRKLSTMMDELENINPDYVKAMTETPEGVILGKDKLKSLQKQIGDRIRVTAFGGYKDLDLDLTIVGTFPDLPRYNQAGVMNRDYLQRSLDAYERKNGKKHPAADKNLNLVWLRVPDTSSFSKLTNQVMSSPNYTSPAVKCETASSGSSTFFESYRDLLRAVKWILVPALLIVMAMVMAMAISISVRERRTEMAVLKVLGFTPGRILLIVLGEALLVGGLSGLVSAALAYGLINGTIGGIPLPLAWIGIWPILADAFWWGILFGAATSFIGSILPALNARRIKVSEVFAKVA
jgi:putative ABC transport system permease protein